MKYTLNKVLFAVIASLLISQITLANEIHIQGAEDPKLQQAIELWLDDNDEQSLPALSTLAKEGNIAARLLLARIEETDVASASSRYVRSLSPEQRHALYRSAKNDSDFYPSWLAFEAEQGNPLAQALFRARFTVVDIPLIKKLSELGEPEASNDLIRSAGFYGTQSELDQLLTSDIYPMEWRPLLQGYIRPIALQAEGRYALKLIAETTDASTPQVFKSNNTDTYNAAKYMMIGLPYATINPGNEWYSAVEEWFMTSGNMRPIANLCSKSCPHETAQCAIGVMGLQGGYFESIRIDSPLENIIPQQQFLGSQRAQGIALRRAALRRANIFKRELMPIEALAESSQCLADLVIQTRSED